MKRLVILATLFGAIAAPAMAMPDALLEAGVYTPATTPVVSYTAVPNADTTQAVKEFVVAWAYVNEQVAAAKRHEAEHRMTDDDRAWLRFARHRNPVKRLSYHLDRRLEFYKRSHTWNAQNKYDRPYNYTLQPKQDTALADTPSKGYTNSYGWNVLYEEVNQVKDVVNSVQQPEDVEAVALAILNASNQVGQSVDNEELRYYLNEILWFSAKQTQKELLQEAPKPVSQR